MMFYNFITTTHAKWILTGEHAVLRGHAALVFPIKTHQLTLSYSAKNKELDAEFHGEHGSDMHLLFWSVLQEGHQLIGHSINQLNGHFIIDSNIPVGVGMGASAALCVAMAQWFAAQELITNESITEFAKQLEHLFHGQSSGLDIMGVSSNTGVYFQQGDTKPIHQSWSPHWYLSYCGQLGVTVHCIQQVNKLWQNNPAQAQLIDQQMNQATTIARMALEKKDDHSFNLLINAIKQSADCFQRWGLISDNLSQHIQSLYDAGALAVKPTGSGNGGFVLSLWDKPLDRATQTSNQHAPNFIALS